MEDVDGIKRRVWKGCNGGCGRDVVEDVDGIKRRV